MMDAIGGALTRPGTYTGQVRELLSVASCAARYPLGVFERRPDARPGVVGHPTPVVLLHGFGHNRSGWHVLETHLREAGFGHVSALNYNPWQHAIPEVAERLAERIDVVRGVAGADRVHLVGHSLGGIILRWYIQEHGGADLVNTAVTVASPHGGAQLARLALGETARALRPGSWLLRRLDERAQPSAVRWFAFYSNLDLVVPGPSAMLRHPALGATNLLAKDQGHVSVLLSRRVAAAVTGQLEAGEGVAGLGTVHALPTAS